MAALQSSWKTLSVPSQPLWEGCSRVTAQKDLTDQRGETEGILGAWHNECKQWGRLRRFSVFRNAVYIWCGLCSSTDLTFVFFFPRVFAADTFQSLKGPCKLSKYLKQHFCTSEFVRIFEVTAQAS